MNGKQPRWCRAISVHLSTRIVCANKAITIKHLSLIRLCFFRAPIDFTSEGVLTLALSLNRYSDQIITALQTLLERSRFRNAHEITMSYLPIGHASFEMLCNSLKTIYSQIGGQILTIRNYSRNCNSIFSQNCSRNSLQYKLGRYFTLHVVRCTTMASNLCLTSRAHLLTDLSYVLELICLD